MSLALFAGREAVFGYVAEHEELIRVGLLIEAQMPRALAAAFGAAADLVDPAFGRLVKDFDQVARADGAELGRNDRKVGEHELERAFADARGFVVAFGIVETAQPERAADAPAQPETAVDCRAVQPHALDACLLRQVGLGAT